MKACEINDILKAEQSHIARPDDEIEHLLTDSRRLVEPQGTLFFAITTARNSGSRYVDELRVKGVRNFVVPAGCEVHGEGLNVWHTHDVVGALQAIAASHRRQFKIPVVGITGSNGKTIVKDWLVQLLSTDKKICASPKSYNSQIGVPLSVWQLSEGDEMGVFEAGISQSGEMQRLQAVIEPTIGLITNIGQAHDENFATREEKIAEKLRLFEGCESLVYCANHKELQAMIESSAELQGTRLFAWGKGEGCAVRLINEEVLERESRMLVRYGENEFTVAIPFADKASRENAMQCVTLLLLLGYRGETIAERCARLTPVAMRMEMNEAVGGSLLLNDSYSLDINSLTIALDYLQHIQQHKKKSIILSDLMQTGVPDKELYTQVATLVARRGISRVVGIGPAITSCRGCFSGMEADFYGSTQEFIESYDLSQLSNQTILLKGARIYAFEQIAKLLQRKNHETVMEVNLDALVHNLNHFRAKLRRGTKLMAMVKAASYGAGRVEVAAALQYNHADYLTVAYADEGVELRRGGITLPIMVMNPEEAAFDDIIRYHLEPDIYSFRIMNLFAERLRLHGAEHYPIHIEFDTGMHRLGFDGSDRARIDDELRKHAEQMQVVSCFSHLACADDPSQDDFTLRQIERFKAWSHGMPGMKHILNSSGISRFGEAQMDMVRLGIGLYGIAPEPEVQAELKQVSRLVTRISQIKEIPAGDTVGYNQHFRAERDTRIAIVTIGYADGLHRHLGCGRGRVLLNGSEVPIVGNICMDMCFLDVTGVPCNEGDRVVIFGEGDLLQRNAAAAGTIAYELLTAVAPRVRRVYYHEQ